MSWMRAGEVESFLKQTKVWRDITNTEIPLDQIDARYAKNILGFLEHKAEELLDLSINADLWAQSQMDAPFSMDEGSMAAARNQKPVEWMWSRPLYKAIAGIAYA